MAPVVTPKELGSFLKLTETTIYKLAANGDLPGFKIGGSWRFDMEEILGLVNGQGGRTGEMNGIEK